MAEGVRAALSVEKGGDAMTILELLDGLDLVGFECTCCGGEARKQCADMVG